VLALALFASVCTTALPATSLRVVDGDTVEATVVLPLRTLRREVFRLSRIDAPEMPTPEGVASKAALSDHLTPGPVTVASSKTDKYGRWLGEFCLGGESVNEWMVTNGWARWYP
jgi:endonuclease YncB( thermonuclease family)